MSAVSSPARFWMQIVGTQVQKLDKLVDEMTEYYTNADNRDLHKVRIIVFLFVLVDSMLSILRKISIPYKITIKIYNGRYHS